MGSKIFLVLGLLMAIVLLIPVEVAARGLAETSANHKQNGDAVAKTKGVYDAMYGAYRRILDIPPYSYGNPKKPPYTYGNPQNPPYTYGVPTPP